MGILNWLLGEQKQQQPQSKYKHGTLITDYTYDDYLRLSDYQTTDLSRAVFIANCKKNIFNEKRYTNFPTDFFIEMCGYNNIESIAGVKIECYFANDSFFKIYCSTLGKLDSWLRTTTEYTLQSFIYYCEGIKINLDKNVEISSNILIKFNKNNPILRSKIAKKYNEYAKINPGSPKCSFSTPNTFFVNYEYAPVNTFDVFEIFNIDVEFIDDIVHQIINIDGLYNWQYYDVQNIKQFEIYDEYNIKRLLNCRVKLTNTLTNESFTTNQFELDNFLLTTDSIEWDAIVKLRGSN